MVSHFPLIMTPNLWGISELKMHHKIEDKKALLNSRYKTLPILISQMHLEDLTNTKTYVAPKV
jgi:hypothetical protein